MLRTQQITHQYEKQNILSVKIYLLLVPLPLPVQEEICLSYDVPMSVDACTSLKALSTYVRTLVNRSLPPNK